MYLFVPGLASLSAQDTVDSNEPSLSLAPEFALWVLSSGKPTRLPSSQIEWQKARWIHVLSTTIWNPSTAARIADEWISSLPVFRVRARASPESDSESTTLDGSGPKSSASISKRKRRGSSSKTSPVSSPLIVAEHSRKSSGTWHRAGSLRNGTVSPREPSVPRTSAIVGSCSLPTPSASQYGSSQNGINGVGGENERPSAGRPSLVTAAREGLLPTPAASDSKRTMGQGPRHRNHGPTLHEAMIRALPTPRASDSSRGAHDARDRQGGEGPTLPDVAVRGLDTPSISSGPSLTSGASTGNGAGLLSPSFVEWMMGLPSGWAKVRAPTPTPTSSTSSEMVLLSMQPRLLSSSSGIDSTELSYEEVRNLQRRTRAAKARRPAEGEQSSFLFEVVRGETSREEPGDSIAEDEVSDDNDHRSSSR